VVDRVDRDPGSLRKSTRARREREGREKNRRLLGDHPVHGGEREDLPRALFSRFAVRFPLDFAGADETRRLSRSDLDPRAAIGDHGDPVPALQRRDGLPAGVRLALHRGLRNGDDRGRLSGGLSRAAAIPPGNEGDRHERERAGRHEKAPSPVSEDRGTSGVGFGVPHASPIRVTRSPFWA
jgi:hypothetical protein